jgi:peptidoglycan-N-acetylglucosamine deacetylase
MGEVKLKIRVRIWLAVERMLQRLLHLQTIESQDDLLLFRIRPYRGKQPILLDDGTEIKQGDEVMEIHLNNHYLLHLHGQSGSDVRLAKSLIRNMKSILIKVASYLNHPDRESVKALYGISLIHQGAQVLGFSTSLLSKGLFSRITTWYLRFLMTVLHPLGRLRLQEKTEQLIPMQIILSRSQLFSLYAKKI